MKNLFFTLMITLLTLSTGKAAPAMHPLTPKEATLITIAAQTARGNIDALTPALRQALDVGIPLEDLKEILTQLYAYCGFPRSLNALQALMTVANERAVNGLPTTQGCTPSPLPNESSLRFGTENQTKLCGRPVTGPLFDFAPAIDTYLKAHLFGDIFGRDNLDWRTRELATIAALAAMPGVESQLRAHIRIGKQNGLTEAHIQAILETVAGNAFGVPTLSPFPVGQENTAYAQYFSGKSYLARLTRDTRLNAPAANVTFEPGCRNNWHRHTGGQLLIAVGGIGFYQERGKPARKLLPGDVVEVPPDTDHWHGAAPASWFSHLAIECNPAANKNTWLEPVSNADYAAATKE